MTVQSFTGTINTNGDYATVESLTSVDFTSGYTYTMQIQNTAWLKIGDAEFVIHSDNPFDYVAGTDDLYIKTKYDSCTLTILEKASA